MNIDDILSIDEVAETLHCSISNINMMMLRGKLIPIKTLKSGAKLFDRKDVETLKDQLSKNKRSNLYKGE